MLSILIRLGHTKYIDVSNSGQLPDIISQTIFFLLAIFFHSFCGMVVCQAIHAILHVVYMFIGFSNRKKMLNAVYFDLSFDRHLTTCVTIAT